MKDETGLSRRLGTRRMRVTRKDANRLEQSPVAETWKKDIGEIAQTSIETWPRFRGRGKRQLPIRLDVKTCRRE